MKYRIDELGWLQFETLVQTLLKASLGLGVENWAGSGDRGRDHFCQSPLAFPAHVTCPGPFLFQSKFVSGANGAGANFKTALLSAVKAEKVRIVARREEGIWDDPRHYVLITNCPVTPDHRREIAEEISKSTSGLVTILGASDLEGMLASYPDVRNHFPQLLGLSDLNELLLAQVNKEIRERSASAIAAASGLERIFVPTDAFSRAQQILSKHRFCVLEGPPEVGKTAIARVLSLLRILDGWEAIECKRPSDFYSTFAAGKRQFFVADDAFGRTEFDPSMAREWERELEKILFRIDADHELCWTSRKHILERALRKMDLQGRATNFPNPSAVVVDAAQLTLKEKTLMLLRHAQSVSPDLKQVEIVQKHARIIVASHDFTPERIRRFVWDVLPKLANEDIEKSAIAKAVRQAIADPTVSMRKSFGALSTGHRLLLYVMIEQEWVCEESALEAAYSSAASDFLVSEPFDQILEELLGTFLRQFGDEGEDRLFDWIHPSVRDMVIDELAERQNDRERFIRRGGAICHSLALSEFGGRTGARSQPLLRHERDWRLLEELQARTLRDTPNLAHRLVTDLLAVNRELLSTEEQAWLERLVRGLLSSMESSVESGSLEMTPALYSDLCSLSVSVFPPGRLPSPVHIWDSCLSQARSASSEWGVGCIAKATPFFSLVSQLKKSEPRFLDAIGFPEIIEADLDALEAHLLGLEVDENESLTDQRDEIEESIQSIANLMDAGVSGMDWDGLHDHLSILLEDLEEQISRSRDSDDDGSEHASSSESEFSLDMVESVMRDLHASA